MKRTRKLMTSITTSLLVTGIHGVGSTSAAQSPPTQRPAARSPHRNSASRAADEVYEKLKHVPESEAKTIDDIARDLPNLSRESLQRAIDQATDEERLEIIGHGTTADPYRYYGHSSYSG